MNFHIHIKIDDEIERMRKGKGTILEGNFGEVWNLLHKKKEEGKIYRSGCDNMKEDGSCGGHKLT